MRIFRDLLVHLCVICSIVCIVAMVLDWYNPFMDFSGHVAYIRIILYVAVLIAAFVRSGSRKNKRK